MKIEKLETAVTITFVYPVSHHRESTLNSKMIKLIVSKVSTSQLTV